jgi:hypothetical protein
MLDSIDVFTMTRSISFYYKYHRCSVDGLNCVSFRDMQGKDCRSFLDILSRIIYRIERDISRLLSFFFFIVDRVV